MIPCRDNALLLLLSRIDQLQLAPVHVTPKAGRKIKYSNHLFLKAAVIMSVRRFSTVFELLSTVQEPTREMQRLREHLSEGGQMPTRRTFERRLKRINALLPSLICQMGAFLVVLLDAWKHCGRASAMDSTVLRAKDNAVWHKKHKEKGEIPHSRIDTEAGWTKSGWHGWVYGWKLHVASTVSDVWIPLAARLTVANVYDGEIGKEMVPELPRDVRFVLGDQHYRTEDMAFACHLRGLELVATRSGKYPHKDSGVGVRRIFHQLRSKAMENFNEHFKTIFDSHCDVPTKGKAATTLFALSAILRCVLKLR